MTRRHVSLMLLASSLAHAQVPPYANGLPLRTTRACSNEAFTLEVPVAQPGFAIGFEASFRAFFGGSTVLFDCPGCSEVRPVLQAVFPDYSDTVRFSRVPPSRRDGHRRAFIVTFSGKVGSTWAPTRPAAGSDCQLTKTIRRAAAQAMSLVEPTSCCTTPLKFLVSRSCEAVVQDAEFFNTPTATSWAIDRVKPPPPASLPPVQVALVDTGVPSGFWSGLGVHSEVALPSFETTAGGLVHPHGTHMAALVHAAAPHASIQSARALDENGMGSLSSVARAIDDVLFASGRASAGTPPMAINLSVGAPPDMARPASLGASCTTWEDGAGESLRYALRVAADVDAMGTVFIAAAGGNSVLEKTTPSIPTWLLGTPRTPCAGDPGSGGPSSFLPAGFGDLPSCIGTSWRALPVVPVGATTFSDTRSVVTQLAAQPYLLAPGERVFASNGVLPRAPANIACGSGDLGATRGFESPAAVTGTSASTALVTAAAAHVMARTPAGPFGQGGWRSAWLARLLYLSGQSVCERGVPGLRRRLDIDRAVFAATSIGCASLRACVASSAHTGPVINGATHSTCAAAVAACFASRPLPTCRGGGSEPGWGAGFAGTVPFAAPTCTRPWGADAGVRTTRSTVPEGRHPDVQLAGLGPQPANAGCPNCWVQMGEPMRLFFELSDVFPPETIFRDAFVMVLDAEKNLLESIPVSDGEPWRPGMVGKLELRSDSARVREVLSAGGSLALDLGVVVPPRGRITEARLVSPLRVEDP